MTSTHLGIVMEYAAGGELFDRIVKAGRFSEDEPATSSSSSSPAWSSATARYGCPPLCHPTCSPNPVCQSLPCWRDDLFMGQVPATVVSGSSPMTGKDPLPKALTPQDLVRGSRHGALLLFP